MWRLDILRSCLRGLYERGERLNLSLTKQVLLVAALAVGLLFVFPTPSQEAEPLIIKLPKVQHEALEPRDYAFVLVAKIWGERAEYACLSKLWGKESAWNHRAANPHSTAFGIPQFLDSTWTNYGYPVRPKNPHVQIEAGLKYIKARYQTPCEAWKFWQKRKWY